MGWAVRALTACSRGATWPAPRAITRGTPIRCGLRRGLSPTGLDIGADTTIPELTVSTDGLHWHPAGADAATSPDMLLAGPGTPLAAGKRLVAERFFTARLADGSLPRPYQCAI